MTKGEKQGIHLEKIRIAKKMLKKGFDIDTIIDVIALDRKKIEKLISTSNK
jgi:hypothetical protein